MAIQDLTASLDLKQNLNIYITCKQFDNLNLILNIFDNSVQANLTGYNVRLRAMKSDQVPLIQEHTGITINSNIVNINADEQLTTTAGDTPIELQFIDSTGNKKATFNLVLKVVPSVIAVSASISTATYTLLEELENKLDQATDYFENLTEFIEQHPDIPALDTRVTNVENEIETARGMYNNLDERLDIYDLNTSKINNLNIINVKDYGAIGDGSSHLLSSKFATLASAQTVYPNATSLSDEIDLVAIQKALNYAISLDKGGTIYIPTGRYKINRSITFDTTKYIKICGEGYNTQISGTSNFNSVIFECHNCGVVFSDLMLVGATSGTSNGIYAAGCNTSIFTRINFQNQVRGLELNASYSVEVNSCVFEVCYTYGIISTTSCHNLNVNKCNFYTCGVQNSGQAIRILVGSDNLIFNDNDFEYCFVAFQLQDCRSISICRNYIEYCSENPIVFTGLCSGVSISENFLSLGSKQFIIQNVTNGIMARNTIYNQNVSYGSNVMDFIIGNNIVSGTSVVNSTKLNAITLINSWTAQSNYSDVGYIKDSNGIVHLEGNILNSTAILPSVAFSLPVGYRPNKILTFGTSGTSGFNLILVNPNGDVIVSTAPGSHEVGLNGITFFARQ
ncbi:glycosyl hydrolase family 28-related protein [Clostridium beijerinckii]|uniref:Rhamnogalacturonase A/B/Epimerase-like pectate lyase domain-containing protein n=1 Tax=Clostridium beijerinckii TaxID=1520 RepID=A0AAX0B007_CLOBE|nr:glycosyl hydrolase family 28-related protein [Clostridium beijerinckii]NRT88522.1 hypothetical protein [Clostridium beijerinckii]NYC73977.1 hypothetical protein [Clostridium beijerinckii]